MDHKHRFDRSRRPRLIDVVDRLDTATGRSYHRAMPMWRCPHCGTPQAETARCWVCHRSSTSCATCRHFRHSVVASVGYCGLDRTRSPLRGDEIRACWDDAGATLGPGGAGTPVDSIAIAAAGPPEFSLFADPD